MPKTIKYIAATVIITFLIIVTYLGAKPIIAIAFLTLLMSGLFFSDIYSKRNSASKK